MDRTRPDRARPAADAPTRLAQARLRRAQLTASFPTDDEFEALIAAQIDLQRAAREATIKQLAELDTAIAGLERAAE